jgi:hypothetical protein
LSKLNYQSEPAQAPAPIVDTQPVVQPTIEVTQDIPRPIAPELQPAAPASTPATPTSSKKNLFKKKGPSPLNKLEGLETPDATIVNNTTGERGVVAPEQPAPRAEFSEQSHEAAPPAPVAEPVPLRPKKKTKTPKQKKVPATTEVVVPPPDATEMDYDQFELELEQDELNRAVRTERAERRGVVFNRVGMIALITGCVYLLFLIYGALNTQYVYNDHGKLVPQVMSVEQIRAREDFEKVQSEYLQARRIYEEVLKLDYRLAAGVEDPLLIAPEYEEVLNMVNDLLMQCQAMSVSDRYKQTHDLLIQWLGGVAGKQSVASYCQNMSKAISLNDPTAASHALEEKRTIYNMFSTITANLTTLGKTVDGVDLGDIPKWSPEKYINESIGGIGGEL